MRTLMRRQYERKQTNPEEKKKEKESEASDERWSIDTIWNLSERLRFYRIGTWPAIFPLQGRLTKLYKDCLVYHLLRSRKCSSERDLHHCLSIVTKTFMRATVDVLYVLMCKCPWLNGCKCGLRVCEPTREAEESLVWIAWQVLG